MALFRAWPTLPFSWLLSQARYPLLEYSPISYWLIHSSGKWSLSNPTLLTLSVESSINSYSHKILISITWFLNNMILSQRYSWSTGSLHSLAEEYPLKLYSDCGICYCIKTLFTPTLKLYSIKCHSLYLNSYHQSCCKPHMNNAFSQSESIRKNLMNKNSLNVFMNPLKTAH